MVKLSLRINNLAFTKIDSTAQAMTYMAVDYVLMSNPNNLRKEVNYDS